MIKSIGKLTLAAVMAAVIASAPLAASAQTTNAPVAPKAAHPGTFRPTKIAAVDKTAKTITLGDKASHVLQVTGESKIFIDKKPATIDDVAVGQMATGSYTKADGGKYNLKTLNIHSAPAAK